MNKLGIFVNFWEQSWTIDYKYYIDKVKKLGFDDMIILALNPESHPDYVAMGYDGCYAYGWGVGGSAAAMNISLSWYDSAYYKTRPELVGEPLGYTILDGKRFANSSWTFDETTQKYTKHAKPKFTKRHHSATQGTF